MRARPDAPSRVFVFAGPTLSGSESARKLLRTRTFRLRPPVRRGDIETLCTKEKVPSVALIVDGVFHDALAVGHAEIRDAMKRGWKVWGLSSMGAIRAREMQTLGMRGFGQVFQRFVDEEDFQDDEVTLLHESAPPYKPVTEPLVHLRVAIDHLIARGIVPSAEGHEVVTELKSIWYAERTIRGTVEAFRRRNAKRGAIVHAELADFSRFRIKTHDLERCLAERPWERA